MAATPALAELLQARRVWRGSTPARTMPAADAQPTGLAALDACLPAGGWPPASLSEILIPADGVGELALVFPTLARLSRAGRRIVVVAPPYPLHAPGWHSAGIVLQQLAVVAASDAKDGLWAAEQCLRSGSCAAVLCWPRQADDRSLRRLQVAAETGQCLGFAFRDARAARNPSPAALRLQIDARAGQLWVRKCRGGLAPPQPFALGRRWH